MQVNGIISPQIVQKKQSFKSDSANSGAVSNPEVAKSSQPAPSSVSKAYATPQITQGYKEIQTFDVKDVGTGKLYELANGHKIVLIPKIGPTFINTYVGVGVLNESAKTKEISHLLEHLLADYCTNPKTKDVDNIVSKTGANTNASTTDLFTTYYIKAPITTADDFENLIKVHSGTLTNTDFTDEQIENEKEIISAELNSRNTFKSDYLLARKHSIQNLFNLKNSDDIINSSSQTTLKNIKKEDLVNYYNTFYQPKNMVTTIVGAIDENTIKTVAKYIGKIQNPPKPTSEINSPKLSTDNLIQKTVRNDVQSLDKKEEKTWINLSFVGSAYNDDKDSIMLGGVRQAFREMLEQYVKTSEHDMDFIINTDKLSLDKSAPRLLSVDGNCSKDDTEKDLKTIYSILYNLASQPISDSELKTIKNKLNSNVSYVNESAEMLTDRYSGDAFFSEDLSGKDYFSTINSMTAQDIQNIAKKYLNLNKASLVVVHPQEKPKPTPFDKVRTTKKTTFTGNVDLLGMKDIHEYVLPNNLKVVIDSRPGISRTTINFDLHSKKTLYNNSEAAGGLISMLVSEKTKETLENQGISLYASGNSQEIFANFNGDSNNTLEMLGYATGILYHPDISLKELDKHKKLCVKSDELEAKSSDDVSTYEKINDEILKGSPYHYVKEKGHLNDLELDDIKNLHQQILKNAQGSVYITIPKDKLEIVQNEIFKMLMQVPPLQKTDYSTIRNKIKAVPLSNTKVFVKKKDGSQLEVEQTFKIIESGNIKDRAGLLLLNNLLGSGEKSKLFKYLRNEDKIAYSPYSIFSNDSGYGKISRIILSTEVSADKDNLCKVIEEYKKSINELISTPATQDELDNAKANLRSGIFNEMETSQDKNNSLLTGNNSFYGVNYQPALLDAIDKMTPEYLQQLAKYYLTQPYLMSVAGNKEIIEANKAYIEKLGEVVDCTKAS